jgi:hypothetical protein
MAESRFSKVAESTELRRVAATKLNAGPDASDNASRKGPSSSRLLWWALLLAGLVFSFTCVSLEVPIRGDQVCKVSYRTMSLKKACFFLRVHTRDAQFSVHSP